MLGHREGSLPWTASDIHACQSPQGILPQQPRPAMGPPLCWQPQTHPPPLPWCGCTCNMVHAARPHRDGMAGSAGRCCASDGQEHDAGTISNADVGQERGILAGPRIRSDLASAEEFLLTSKHSHCILY